MIEGRIADRACGLYRPEACADLANRQAIPTLGAGRLTREAHRTADARGAPQGASKASAVRRAYALLRQGVSCPLAQSMMTAAAPRLVGCRNAARRGSRGAFKGDFTCRRSPP